MGAHRKNPFARGTVIDLPSIIKDAYAHPLTEGDEVICPQVELKAPRFVITAIRPDLSPQAQPNTAIVTLTCSVSIVTRVQHPLQNVFLIRTAEEIAEATGQPRPTPGGSATEDEGPAPSAGAGPVDPTSGPTGLVVTDKD